MKLITVATMAFLVLSTTAANAASYVIADGQDGNEVVFHSKAPMESFEGKTNRASGTFELDPSSLGDLSLVVRVDMASLDTGISLRNRHMRENHLETDKYPTSTFRATKLLEGAGSDLTSGKTIDTLVEGEFELHGVTRTIQVPIQFTMDASNGSILVQAEFFVELPDYKIKRPKFLVVKLANEQRVTVELRGTPSGN